MTNGERADRLFADAGPVSEEMRAALHHRRWNLATRRAQEVIELVVKALLNEMSVEYPRTHDPLPLLVDAVRVRKVDIDLDFIAWLAPISANLAEIRAPAFYQEIVLTEDAAC
ncbi:MAG: HEPN domain-containing protein, partial [Candidatus Rokuibacteriota bacterium]